MGWYRTVAISMLTLAFVVAGVDVVLLMTGKPTISQITWEQSTHMLSIPAFWGYLMGHWFLPLRLWFSRIRRFVVMTRHYWWCSLITYMVLLVTLDLSVGWELPYWLVSVVFLVNIPIGSVFWNMKRSSDPPIDG